MVVIHTHACWSQRDDFNSATAVWAACERTNHSHDLSAMFQRVTRWRNTVNSQGENLSPSRSHGQSDISGVTVAVCTLSETASIRSPNPKPCVGIEPTTYCLQNSRTTAVLTRQILLFSFLSMNYRDSDHLLPPVKPYLHSSLSYPLYL